MEEKIAIFGKNLDVSDRIHNYVVEKLGKIDRFLSDYDDVRVDLTKIKSGRSAAERYGAQITIKGRGYMLRAEEKDSEELSLAIDTALDKLFRQIERFKGKRSRGRGDGASLADSIPVELDQSVDAAPAIDELIVRRKKFQMIPMSEEEAIEQMALSDHDNFFIFFNADTSAVNVLYKRNDGKYGLIEPEVA